MICCIISANMLTQFCPSHHFATVCTGSISTAIECGMVSVLQVVLHMVDDFSLGTKTFQTQLTFVRIGFLCTFLVHKVLSNSFSNFHVFSVNIFCDAKFQKYIGNVNVIDMVSQLLLFWETTFSSFKRGIAENALKTLRMSSK